jgi:two-component system, NarL family, nitrate/nitrite response regulator NarL
MVLTDVRLYREGLAQLLAGNASVELVGAGPITQDTFRAVIAARPDVVLLEAAVACRMTVVQELVPTTKVVAYGVQDEGREGLRCAEAGVAAFVNGEATAEELVHTILGAARGEFCCSPRISAMLVERLSVLARGTREDRSESRLTQRELGIVTLIDEGLSNKEIASRLGIALPTVKNHVHHILEKLHASRRAQAASRFRRAHLQNHDDEAPGAVF